MADDNKTRPMQADGQDSPKRRPDGTEPDRRGRGPDGESGGGAYANDTSDPLPSSEKA